ncbi:hypothetical protein MXB_1801 [Myxobolus squamalis]|nr:hypothetical protein MXB_1801 [Myxobolus squamalis]
MRFFPIAKFISRFQVKWTGFPIKYEFQQEEKTKISILPSGLRVVTHHVSGPTATVGLFIDSGSRAESEKNNGVAHFFEHMAFKGTTKMSQPEMENLVENLGTRLFAYTSREQTVYYGKCFSSDAPKVLEILSDIIQRPLLSEKAIERERSVITREMEDIDTQLDEVIFDHLHGTAYQGSPLSYTILGPSENIKKISKKDLENYIKRHYTAGRIVLIAVGDVDHEEYVKLADIHLSQLPATSDADLVSWYKPAKYLGSSALFRNDDMPFAHITYAYEGVPATHPDFIPLMLASTYIGSWDQSCTNGKVMPSFLAQESAIHDKIRTFTSFYAAYKDTALWGIYYTGNGYQLEDFAQTVSLQMSFRVLKL